MEFCIFVEPQQGASYARILRIAQLTERLGFDGFFTSDHYLKMGDVDGGPGPLDAWTTMAGLARETVTVRLGTLVSPVTFRLPGSLAVAVTQVDDMSGGRVELGIGAGWYEAEHITQGIPFLTFAERFELMEENLRIITGLWATPVGETFDHPGPKYPITGSPGMPKPSQSKIPVIIGGRGKVKTPRLAALFADEFNVGFTDVTEFVTRTERVRQACVDNDRDPETMKVSIALAACCGASDDDLARRAEATLPPVDVLQNAGAYGSPADVKARLEQYAAAGADRVYLQLWDIDDLAHVELLAEVKDQL